MADAIDRDEALRGLKRLESKSRQWRGPYKHGWDDAIESAKRAVNNCRSIETLKESNDERRNEND